nr:MAG TPA: hypothetical protein [Caudoviricetes sp.]
MSIIILYFKFLLYILYILYFIYCADFLYNGIRNGFCRFKICILCTYLLARKASPKRLTCVRCAVGVLSEVNCTFIGNYEKSFRMKWLLFIL